MSALNASTFNGTLGLLLPRRGVRRAMTPLPVNYLPVYDAALSLVRIPVYSIKLE
jgi:hypothetical protein